MSRAADFQLMHFMVDCAQTKFTTNNWVKSWIDERIVVIRSQRCLDNELATLERGKDLLRTTFTDHRARVLQMADFLVNEADESPEPSDEAVDDYTQTMYAAIQEAENALGGMMGALRYFETTLKQVAELLEQGVPPGQVVKVNARIGLVRVCPQYE
jgi:hypothetical protein